MRTTKVHLRGDDVVVEVDGRPSASFSLQDVAVLGESTSEARVHSDDYWVVLVLRPDAAVHEIPTSSAGLDELIAALRTRRGFEFEYGLANSTEPRSLVHWPRELAGEPVFDIEYLRRTGLWGRLVDAWFTTYSQRPTARVLAIASK